tara:strand:+ start:10333 stop:10539 length:207 start_codon:yes stop_codon:yes gene_type:complete
MDNNMRKIKVEGEPNLVRDLDSNAIINTNKNEYDKFVEKSRQKNKINKIEEELNEIKSLLKKLLKDNE